MTPRKQILVEFFRTERPDEGWIGDEHGETPEQCAIRVMRSQARQLKAYRILEGPEPFSPTAPRRWVPLPVLLDQDFLAELLIPFDITSAEVEVLCTALRSQRERIADASK